MKADNFILSELNELFMKRNILFFLALSIGIVCSSQYTVTKVIGHITNKTSGESLYAGSKLRDEDVLTFSSLNDMLRVIVPGKGIYVVSPGPRSEKQQNVIVEMLKTALKIKSREGYLSGRSEEDELIPGLLKTDATVNKNNLVGLENKYRFDPKAYSIANGNRFFLQTEIAGSKPLIHPLKTIADTLFIYANDFEKNNAKYKLGFFSKEKNKSVLLTEIRPLLDSSHELETIVKLVITENRKKDKALLRRSCYAEVYEALGKPPAILFDNIFEMLYNEISKKAN
jgi:hypothetical protein